MGVGDLSFRYIPAVIFECLIVNTYHMEIEILRKVRKESGKKGRRKEGDRKGGRDGGKGLYFRTYVEISAWPTHSPGPSALTQDPCQ